MIKNPVIFNQAGNDLIMANFFQRFFVLPELNLSISTEKNFWSLAGRKLFSQPGNNINGKCNNNRIKTK